MPAFRPVSPAAQLLILLALLCHPIGLRAHQDPQAPVPSLRALKVDAPLKVDGVLDEEFWARAEVGSDFIDQRTHQKADLATTVRVVYTRTHLYIAVECFDDHIAEIRASERREDRSFDGDDWVEVHLDPLHNHQSKYAFFSNPLGTRSDANEGPSGLFNRGWSAEWDLAAKIDPDRWTFEMRIPLSVMNYERKNGQRWGFNVTRAVRRTDATSFWSFNATEMYKPRHFGHLAGLDLADSQFDRNLEITPYVSTRTDFNGDTDTFLKAGLDVSLRLTPSVVSAWTLFPDFGQVEADDDTIELRDTERFLSERRPFFREGDELLRTPHRLYYSRRFTGIDAGANISGQMGGLQFAFLNLQSETVHDGVRYGNSSVLRVLQNVRERSNLGAYVSESEFRDGHSRVLSTDGYFFLTDAWRVRYQLSGADDRIRDAGGVVTKDRLDYLGSATLIYDRYPWHFDAGYNAISKEFNPTLGFIPRRDIFGPAFLAAYNPQGHNSWYKSLLLQYDGQYCQNDAGDRALNDHGVLARVVFPNDLGFRLGHRREYHLPYQNHRTVAGASVFTTDFWKAVELNYAFGTFERTAYHEFDLVKNFKVIERWPIRYEFVVRFEDRPEGGRAMPWLNRVVFDFFFTDKMWIKSSLQHRNDSIHNISLIYGWEFRRRTFFYLVFNNVRNPEESHEGNSIFSKVTYTF